ncbi:MAG TPA: hypothetical protein VMA53_07600 [Stellaceae bacterium]|nr:hypothetical protein [Stellaceae bacterium]
MFERDDEETDRIASYVEWQARGQETVTHAERISTEHVMGQKYEAWDVHTDKGRWWVITPPTNLYSQALMPSLDYTLSFHIGLMARMMSRRKPGVPMAEQALIRAAWRRWEQAAQALDEAEEAEEFQAVGMRCRETLIAMVRKLGSAAMVPAGEEAPEAANVEKWCEIIAGHVARGPSADKVRKYLRDTGKDCWQLVNWLTHSANATHADAVFAIDTTQHVLAIFGTAVFRQLRGIPDRCPECGSYKIGLRQRADGDDDSEAVPACLACEWISIEVTRHAEH